MKWTKLGRIYKPEKEGWRYDHGSISTPDILEDRIRVYVSFWDEFQRSRIGYIDVDKDDPTNVIEVSEKPVLDLGEKGMFDEHGVHPSSIIEGPKGSKYLIYIGWQNHVDIRYTLFAGIAYKEGATFKRYRKTPLMDRNNIDGLFVRSAPFVWFDNKWRIIYIAGSEWFWNNGKELPKYTIRYNEADNIFDFNESLGDTIIKRKSDNEFAFGRPYVVKHKDINSMYEIFYSIRMKDKGYRLGYGTTYDFKSMPIYREDDRIGIDVSSEGWDSEMICFSAVVDVDNERYMFYNGNDYGRSGLGVAVFEGY